MIHLVTLPLERLSLSELTVISVPFERMGISICSIKIPGQHVPICDATGTCTRVSGLILLGKVAQVPIVIPVNTR